MRCLSLIVMLSWCTTIPAMAEEPVERPFGLAVRVPWTSSRLVGSPDPPLPYVTARVLADVELDRPIYAEAEPGTDQLFVVQQGGEADRPSEILRVTDHGDTHTKQSVLSVPNRLVYGLTFHPDYENNGYIYLFSNGPTGETERRDRVTRWTVSRDPAAPPVCDPESRQTIIEWRSMGHDGGDLVFGHDGMLYVTTGDGSSDSDQWLSAQDVTNVLGGILRIDVDQPGNGLPYAVPPDNPFVDTTGARGELWAIGLRNPWRMSIDRRTGQIWVGNNGQDLWETVHLLGRGENYGWSVYEGSHPFYAHRELGPGKLVNPTFEHHHTESRSLTGGVVYYGEQLPELQGAYIYGDHSTGKIWAGRHDGHRVTFHQEIADSPLHIVAFANSPRGELLVVDQTAGIHQLAPNAAHDRPEELSEFPRWLSDTGLFVSVASHQMADGVIPYDVVSPGWNDGATAERFIAVPDGLQIDYTSSRGWGFPDRGVLVQTLSVENQRTTQSSARRIETRILLKQQGVWLGYSYLWNELQTDAELVGGGGKDVVLKTETGSQSWRIPSRAECMSCHARAVNYVLGMTDLQMNRDFAYHAGVDNQLRTLAHINLLAGELPDQATQPRLVDPGDTSASLADRARSYLHTNCAGCHVAAGGGNARMEMEFTRSLEETKMVAEFPQHATFGLSLPRIIAPSAPEQSVLLARLSRRGQGQMPPLVSHQVDESAVVLLREWIASMKPGREFVRDWSMADFIDQLPEDRGARSLEQGKALFKSAGCGQCHRIEEENAGIGPNLNNVAERLKSREILESIVDPSATVSAKYAATMIVTKDGQVIQGRIQSETDETLVLRGSDSLAVAQTIRKSDIEHRQLSQVSMMPRGTINHLQREEVLDLLAYLLAKKPVDGEAERTP